jgi:hypothetical protein
MNIFSLLFTTRFCCSKNRMVTMIHKYNGSRISDEFACRLCICIFIMNLILTDIVLRAQLIPLLLYLFCSSFISTSGIAIIGFSINTYVVVSLYFDIHCLVKTINCKCVEYVNEESETTATAPETIHRHDDNIYGHMHGHID